jgi:hypothetical protein
MLGKVLVRGTLAPLARVGVVGVVAGIRWPLMAVVAVVVVAGIRPSP